MANQPTIVAASLSDQTLRDSINKLVTDVNNSVNSMAQNFNTAIGSMEAKLKSLRDAKIDIGGASSGGGTKKVVDDQKSLEEQTRKTTQSIKEQNLTLDQQSASLKGATKGAVDEVSNSYANLIKQIQQQAQLMDMRYTVTPIQELRMRQHELEAGMRTASDNAAKAKKDFDELDAAIRNYRTTMESLPKDQQGFANRQAIQKEINDLIVLRDVAASEQQKWTSAVETLSTKYATVTSEINRIGQALIDEEQKENKVTSALDKQLQKISEIASRKEATLALKSISGMESSDLEKAEMKLANLKALKDKVKNTDLMSQKGMAELDHWIKYTTSLVERFGQKTQKNAKDDEEALKKAADAERQWAENIRQRGQVAQDTSRKMIRMLHDEAQAGGSGLMGFYKIDNKDINAVKELQNAIKDMQMQYNLMTDSEKESAVGRALKKDIENAKEAARTVSAYNALASGVERDMGKNAASLTATYSSLQHTLSELTRQYRNLSIEQIKAGAADSLIDKIQKTERAAQQLQARLNRPISLEAALKGSEKTLDDISYKMQRLQAYRQGIDLTKPGADQEILKVDQKLQELQKDADKWMSKSKSMIEQNNALGRSWNYMKNRLAFYFTVGASTQFVKNLIEIRSQYEMNERALGILINSAERGTQIFNELSQMALVSPYTLIELSSAAKQLTAYDIAAKDVVDTTRRLADMASAVGVPMERLTYALGQIKAYGYLNSRDARMFANAGIPLVRELSKYYSELEGKVVSVGDVYDRMKKKAIDYNSVMSVVTKMTDEGGKFFDFQAKMAGTLKVRLANLGLAWNNMLNEMGKSQQGVLTSGIGALRDLFLHWQDIESAMQKVIWALGLWKAAQAIGLIYIGELNTKMGAQILLGKKLGATLSSAAASTKSFMSGYAIAASALLFTIADIIVTSQRNAEEIQRLNQTIADGAKEASEALDKLLHSSEMVSARMSASQGKLSASDATKTWEALREQIELSAMSSKNLINELLLEEDLNERVTKAFGLVERIQEATSKLSDLNDALIISQDSALNGLFGEGIIEDIDDFNASLKNEVELADWASKKTSDFWENAVVGLKGLFYSVKESLGSSRSEAVEEISKFTKEAAQVIKDELGEEGMKDKIQVNEAVARVLKGFEQMYPQVRGKGKVLFETMFNDIMATEFKGSVDRQAYYYNKFLEQLKKDHGSAFGDVTDEVLKDTHKWSSAQLDAINKTADKVKQDLPAASQDAIDQILAQLNSTEFKVRIVAEMATTSLGEVEKQFNEKFIKKPWIADQKEREKAENEAAQKYGNLRRKSTESNVEYEKRISDERKKQLEIQKSNSDIIEANKNKQDAYSKSVVKDAENAKKAADAWLEAANEVEKAGGYDFSTKKERSESSKAQKSAETELQKSLKEELRLIDEVRSQYKKLTDAGVSRAVAMKTVTEQFSDSIEHINAVLRKNGLPEFNIKTFAGTDNPHEMMVMLKKQIDAAKSVKNIKPEEINELEIKYSKIKVDAEAYDATKIKKGLDNELGRLKDEYELAVELDANPELGSMFADMFDIDLDTLPRTAKEYAEVYTKSLNKYFKEMKTDIELPNIMNLTRDDMAEFQRQMEEGKLEKVYFELIQKGYEATQEARKKEVSDAIKSYDKLLEKYAEYAYKVKAIEKNANQERKALVMRFGTDEQKEDVARIVTKLDTEEDPQKIEELKKQLENVVNAVVGDDKTRIAIKVAIDNKQAQETAKLSFEEFQKSPEWITATGNLSGLTNTAIKSLIDSIEKYKKSARNLDSKQIKQLNTALKNLYKQQRQGNPFLFLANAMDEAKDRASAFDESIIETKKQIDDVELEIKRQGWTKELGNRLDDLKKKYQDLIETQKKVGQVSVEDVVSGVNNTISYVGQIVGIFNKLANAITGEKWSEAQEVMNDTLGMISQVGEGAKLGSSFGTYGAIIGAILGGVSGYYSEFSDNDNKRITQNIKDIEVNIKKLSNTYKLLEYQMENSAGVAMYNLKQIAIANKELQLAEMKRQLQLEESRSSKYRDENKIEDLKGQIRDLELEIKRSSSEIVNDLLGISSVGDAAESMIGSFIDALRNGEDAMDSFNENIDNMIANMVKKLLVTKLIMPRLNEVFDTIQADVDKRTKVQTEELNDIIADLDEKKEWDGRSIMWSLAAKEYGEASNEAMRKEAEKWENEYKNATGKEARIAENEFSEDFVDWVKRMYIERQKERKRVLENEIASAWTEDDIKKYATEIRELSPEIEASMDYVNALLDELGLIKDSAKDKSLSSLQQGIQSITEDTAGALEAYMNSVSQQVYLHSEILTQIRDIMVGYDLDLQAATMGQILLQLQESYQIQQNIHSLLQSALSANGMSFRVEMV